MTNSGRLVTRCTTTFLYYSSFSWGIWSGLQTHNNLISLCGAICISCHLSMLKTHYFSDLTNCSIVGFLKGVGIKKERWVRFERGVLIPFRTTNYRNDKMYNAVVPAKILLQSWTKHLETFSLFSTISLHHKWNGSRILSPESECKSYSRVAERPKT